VGGPAPFDGQRPPETKEEIMEAKDVKIGMKVVPHSKTAGCVSWNEFRACFFGSAYKEFCGDGYLTVKEQFGKGFRLMAGSGDNADFRASDFEPYVEPEEIESREGQGDENGF